MDERADAKCEEERPRSDVPAEKCPPGQGRQFECHVHGPDRYPRADTAVMALHTEPSMCSRIARTLNGQDEDSRLLLSGRDSECDMAPSFTIC